MQRLKEGEGGEPDHKHVSTSYVERQNLTIRMHIRRFTRLTNAFSKKVENHAYAVALHMMYYNFVRILKTLRVTPAMAAGVSTKLWEIGDIAQLVEDAEGPSKKRGALKKISDFGLTIHEMFDIFRVNNHLSELLLGS